MKNSLVKICSIALILILFSSTTCFATTTNKVKTEFLESIGLTQDKISTLSDDEINTLYGKYKDRSGRIISYKSEIHEVKETLNPLTRGTIPTSKLRLTIAVYQPSDQFGLPYGYYEVQYGYEWLTVPVMQTTDAITATWNNSLYHVSEDKFGESFSSGQYGIYDDVDPGPFGTDNQYPYTWSNAPAIYEQGAAGWNFVFSRNSLAQSSIYVDREGGSASIILEKNNFSDTTPSNLTLKYHHNIGLFGLSMNYQGFGISVSGSYDELSTITTIR